MKELCPHCILTWLEDMFFLTDNGDEGKLDGQGQGKQPLKCCKKPVHPLAGVRICWTGLILETMAPYLSFHTYREIGLSPRLTID